MFSSYNLGNGLPVFQALASKTRVQIMNLIAGQDGISPKQISDNLNIPVSTLTSHLNMLCDCGFIFMKEISTKHGHQKQCFLSPSSEQLLISLDFPTSTQNNYWADVPIGNYGCFQITPLCGLATPDFFIGALDDPRYFAHPDRFHAEILWFTSGYLEYALPNFIPHNTVIHQLSISMEISSEAPGFNEEFPSDITFFLNGTKIGTWTSPGDFGKRRGKLNPDWWYSFLNQYGLLKQLVINQEGTFLDGEKLSDVTVNSLSLTSESLLFFRIAVLENARHVGGCTLFGRSFGDYKQNIQIEISYEKQV
ncbi:MAG: ArsR/SmtB family transcription factor [Marvinbryantia sp.]|jgi:predicted transcriptional regulator